MGGCRRWPTAQEQLTETRHSSRTVASRSRASGTQFAAAPPGTMSYLRRFPIDKLKIDRCFVTEMTHRPEDASIVRAIISLAHSLHLKVIAEGVETPEQLALLAELGCDQYQGFYFSPALLPARFADLLKNSAIPSRTLSEEEAAQTHSKLAGL